MIGGAFSLPNLQPLFEKDAQSEEENLFRLMRQMSSMPNVPMPEDQGMTFNPQQLIWGAALSGLFGGAEGANAFLQGNLQGSNLKYQQQQAKMQKAYQQQKLEQDRQLGMLKTEAEIANAKANRAYNRAQQYRADTKESKAAADALKRDMARGRIDILEKIVGAKPSTEGWFPIMFKVAEDSGLGFSPEEKNAIIDLYKKGKAEESQLAFAKSLLTGLRSPSVQARATSARLLKPILESNPGFVGMLGQDPTEVSAAISEGLQRAEEMTVSELLSKERINEAVANGDLKRAQTLKAGVETKLKNFELELQQKYGEAKFKGQIEKLNADIANARAMAKKNLAAAATSGSGPGGKPLTATADMTSWLSAQKEVIDAQKEHDEVQAKVEFWNSVINSPDFSELPAEKQMLSKASLQQAVDKLSSSRTRLAKVQQVAAERQQRANQSMQAPSGGDWTEVTLPDGRKIKVRKKG